MRISKLTVQALVAICLLLILSGCWDNKDINHRVLPVVMGVSKQGSLFKVTLQIPEPGQDTSKVKIVAKTGVTITQAVDKISENLESRVDLLHLKVIIMDKVYARQGLNDTISGFIRSREVSPKALVVICDEDLDFFFSQIKQTKQTDGNNLYDFFEKNAGWNPQIALTRVWQVYRSIHSFTRDVAVPMIKSDKSTLVDNVGSAIIKNGKMVDQISTEDTLLFNAFNGQSAQGKIEVMDHASVLVLSNTMKLESKLKDKEPYMKCTIQLKVSLLEVTDNTPNEQIKKELELMLTKQFTKMFMKIQAKEADILGLGQYYRSKIPREELAHWRSEYYPNLEFDLHIQTIIQNEGNLKNPMKTNYINP
ncbi:Ger(x)C family spore germination protein [Paenibacillus agricola]|uniref:Ger(X)C family spore germination protein n=1 Tax=Paenibacillus agricola TaxID=2716264 RepID=A0ABX0J7B0_9BACL|nr:Ger(x)C family spore germination protein [Paenibacillus agricola]NHN31686.1 Ger(x)C family spore germination protein [Paenibacillus agricola]